LKILVGCFKEGRNQINIFGQELPEKFFKTIETIVYSAIFKNMINCACTVGVRFIVRKPPLSLYQTLPYNSSPHQLSATFFFYHHIA